MDIQDILSRHGFRFSKRWGQNFITDGNLLAALAADAQITPGDTVVEVGAGAGTLTAALAARAGRVVSFEIDENLRPVLAETLQGYENIQLVFGDVLACSDERLASLTGGAYKLAANLPYYITTPILFRFLYDPNLLSATVMVQKEVAERMVAMPATPAYGALSAQLQLMGRVTLTRQVGRQMFRPQPDVDSAVVRLDIEPRCDTLLLPDVRKVIAAAFAMRRKTLANNLAAAYPVGREKIAAALARAQIDGARRGETLSTEEFICLARALREC